MPAFVGFTHRMEKKPSDCINPFTKLITSIISDGLQVKTVLITIQPKTEPQIYPALQRQLSAEAVELVHVDYIIFKVSSKWTNMSRGFIGE